jgi:hypothetical protein
MGMLIVYSLTFGPGSNNFLILAGRDIVLGLITVLALSQPRDRYPRVSIQLLWLDGALA